MSRVKGWDTTTELTVRRCLHKLGYRFRLHLNDLPGKPDIVLPKHKAVIFVHGCFWHGHPGCPKASRPKTNDNFWNKKIDQNIQRDKQVKELLESMGWKILLLWQCQIKDTVFLEKSLVDFLKGAKHGSA
jgi:DNA mismatch endonuclease (patch repair protein)